MNELVSLLMGSLWEAIALVVIVALVGFWDWRAAMLMAASIPLTLALTFGIVKIMGIDIQQVSIATLIIALGLLVDMPVVAGDAHQARAGPGISTRASRPGSGRASSRRPSSSPPSPTSSPTCRS